MNFAFHSDELGDVAATKLDGGVSGINNRTLASWLTSRGNYYEIQAANDTVIVDEATYQAFKTEFAPKQTA